MQSKSGNPFPSSLPAWVPVAARHYLAHTECGLSIRQLARKSGVHASTVMRQVRRFENRRDDPLIDAMLRKLGRVHFRRHMGELVKDIGTMTSGETSVGDDPKFGAEILRILRRLAEPGAVLAVAADMDKAVVVRDSGQGDSTRTAVVDTTVAEAMALQDLIACDAPGRISRYQITNAGRQKLSESGGFAEAPAPFHRAEKVVSSAAKPRKRQRYSAGETPLLGLARRRGNDGVPFLSPDLVAAGERLREDFELAQVDPDLVQNWDHFLTGGVRGSRPSDKGLSGPMAARARVEAALYDLGPGLSDVALRCCCYLEGLEVAEKRMGWSARSGKIVLRIALQRLKRHYDEVGVGGRSFG